MNCEKCGAIIPEGADFCVQCGTKVSGTDTSERVTPQYDTSANMQAGKTFNIKDKLPYLIFAAVALVVIILAVVIFMKVKKTKVNLNEYLEIETTGYDGYGSVVVKFDKDGFVSDYKGKIKPSKKIKSMIKEEDKVKAIVDREGYNAKKGKDACRLFADVFTSAGAVDDEGKTGALSNGDVIVYKWNLDSDRMPVDNALEFAKKAFNVKLVADDLEVTVEDLEKVDTFDAFDGLEVSFSGVAPAVRAEISSYPANTNLEYSLQDNYNLKNGDSVTVVASYGWIGQEEYIKQYNRMPETLEKTFTVEGVDEYITDASQISDSDLDAMKKQTEDKIRAMAAQNWSKEESIGGLEFDSAYMLSAKDTTRSSDLNRIVIVYKINADFKFEDSAYNTSYQYYYYASYRDAVRVQDGSLLVNLNNPESPGRTTETRVKYGPKEWDERSYYFYGYDNFDSLFSDAITKNIETFTYDQIQ